MATIVTAPVCCLATHSGSKYKDAVSMLEAARCLIIAAKYVLLYCLLDYQIAERRRRQLVLILAVFLQQGSCYQFRLTIVHPESEVPLYIIFTFNVEGRVA